MILLSNPLKNDPRKPWEAYFFSPNWDSHNQNSQLKKFKKNSVVSFCRRWTSLIKANFSLAASSGIWYILIFTGVYPRSLYYKPDDLCFQKH